MSATYAPGSGLEELRKVIKDAFSLFQKSDDTIDDADVGTVMRYLGQFDENTFQIWCRCDVRSEEAAAAVKNFTPLTKLL